MSENLGQQAKRLKEAKQKHLNALDGYMDALHKNLLFLNQGEIDEHLAILKEEGEYLEKRIIKLEQIYPELQRACRV